MKKLIKRFFEKYFGIKIIYKKRLTYPHDMEQEFFGFFEVCRDKTMTSTDRLYSVYQAVNYVSKNNIEGDVVECGVWKGGSIMMAGLTLVQNNDTNRKLYLYDTFEGMSAPTDKDINYLNEKGEAEWANSEKDSHNEWCYSPIGEVQNNMGLTKYPDDKIVYVKGMVEATVPNTLPEKISLLRLDTDWYESIYHCLVHMYPRLVPNGVLILDDYGFWKGAQEAVDQYFKEQNIHPLMNRIDQSGRLIIKLGA